VKRSPFRTAEGSVHCACGSVHHRVGHGPYAAISLRLLGHSANARRTAPPRTNQPSPRRRSWLRHNSPAPRRLHIYCAKASRPVCWSLRAENFDRSELPSASPHSSLAPRSTALCSTPSSSSARWRPRPECSSSMPSASSTQASKGVEPSTETARWCRPTPNQRGHVKDLASERHHQMPIVRAPTSDTCRTPVVAQASGLGCTARSSALAGSGVKVPETIDPSSTISTLPPTLLEVLL
jgi:hypothetical protein